MEEFWYSNKIYNVKCKLYNRNIEKKYESLLAFFSSELSSILSDFSAGYHGPSVDKRQDRMTMASYDLESKRLAGLRAMQNRPSPGTYRMPTNSWSGYGISHTSPANFGEKKMKKVSVFFIYSLHLQFTIK